MRRVYGVLLLAACAAANDVRRDGARTDYELSLAPRQAARCLARNAELKDASLTARARETDTLVVEVDVRRGDIVIALAHVAPWKIGAVATIWSTPAARELADAMADGC